MYREDQQIRKRGREPQQLVGVVAALFCFAFSVWVVGWGGGMGWNGWMMLGCLVSMQPSPLPHLTIATHPNQPPPFPPTHPQERAKALRPDMGPAGGAGRQGRIGTTGGTLLTQHLMRTRGGLVGVDEEMDPREAILRHGNKDDQICQLTAAYHKTQPVPIFAEESEEEGEEED